MIDQNRDGYVDKDDLQDIMVSLGNTPNQCMLSFFHVFCFYQFHLNGNLTVQWSKLMYVKFRNALC